MAAAQQREQKDKELAEDGDFWTRLIPETERRAAASSDDESGGDALDEEEALAKEHGYVPARKAALKVTTFNEAKLAEQAAKASKKKQPASGAKAGAAAGKKAMTQKERRERETLSARDMRVLLRGIMRFGWHDEASPPRLDDIVEQGKLQKKDRQMLINTGTALVRMARKIVADPPSAPPSSSSPKGESGGAKKSAKFNPYAFEFRGETVNAQQLVDRIDGLSELRKRIVALGSNARSFRMPVPLRAPPEGWGVGWSPADDAMLLIGVYSFGFGSWHTIRDEKQLRLTDKIAPTQQQILQRLRDEAKPAADAEPLSDEAAKALDERLTAKAASEAASVSGGRSTQLARRVESLLRALCANRVPSSASAGAARSTSGSGARGAASKRKAPAGAAATSGVARDKRTKVVGGGKSPSKPRGAPAKSIVRAGDGANAAGAGASSSSAAVQSSAAAPTTGAARATSSAANDERAATNADAAMTSLRDSDVVPDLYERARRYLSEVRSSLKAMHELPSRTDIDKVDKKRKTKQYLLTVGAVAERIYEDKRRAGTYGASWLEQLRQHLWYYISRYTTTDGAKLFKMYMALQAKLN